MTLAISDGNTVTLDLSSLSSTDSQTLAFAASATTTQTTLTITGGNALTLQASGGLTFNQTGTNTLEMVATAADATRLVDADGDTQVQVEEGNDDDTIRFDADGEERMSISATEIRVGNDLSVSSLTPRTAGAHGQ